MNRETLKETLTEKKISAKQMFDGNIVKIEHWIVELPNKKTALREVAKHVGASAIVALDDRDKVAMVWQYRSPVSKLMLEIPAGKLDDKGEDRLLAAKRELREETGLLAEEWEHLTDIDTTPGFCDEVLSLYLAQKLSQGELEPDEDEFLGVEWFPIETLVAMIMSGELTDAKSICGIMMVYNRLRDKIENKG